MALSTLESSRTRAQHPVCPHCGRSADSPRPAIVEDRIECSGGTGLGIDAGALGCHCLEVVL